MPGKRRVFQFNTPKRGQADIQKYRLNYCTLKTLTHKVWGGGRASPHWDRRTSGWLWRALQGLTD